MVCAAGLGRTAPHAQEITRNVMCRYAEGPVFGLGCGFVKHIYLLRLWIFSCLGVVGDWSPEDVMGMNIEERKVLARVIRLWCLCRNRGRQVSISLWVLHVEMGQ